MQNPLEGSVSICTVNIVDYSGLCEKNESKVVFDLLNKYFFKLIHSVVMKTKGQIDLAIGDRQTIFWCSKNERKNVCNACNAALMIMKLHKEIMEKTLISLKYNIEISITTGICTIFGNPLKIMGQVCNYNMALLNNIRSYGVEIIIDQNTNKYLVNKNVTRELDQIKKGNEIENIYELVE